MEVAVFEKDAKINREDKLMYDQQKKEAVEDGFWAGELENLIDDIES